MLELIPGISALYNILKRNIERGNDVLVQRKELSKELMENCRSWSSILLSTFDKAVGRWAIEGREKAASEIMKLEEDFMKLDYWSLEASSPILLFLKEDRRFEIFADSCANFYKSALYVKRIVYGDIQAHSGGYVSADDVGIKGMVDLWREEVERMLREVSTEYMKVRTIEPK